MPGRSFDDLVEEGGEVDVRGWDFSWFTGRATEARPPWAYQRLVAESLRSGIDVLDLQTGGGEVLAGALQISGAHPATVRATESWLPNRELAQAALAPWAGQVLAAADDEIPLGDSTTHLVTCRHPVATPWPEIARVLRPSGTFLSQQVGRGSVRELTAAMIGSFEPHGREAEVARARAEAAGLVVTRLERASLPMTFDDIGAVIVFLRKVIWTVPDFSIDAYRPQLRALHERIQTDGPFRATSERFLITCQRP